MPSTTRVPLAEFYSIYRDALLPVAPSAAARGALPSRAVSYCPPVTAATGLGWYLFPPVDFALRWNAESLEFTLLAANEPTRWQSMAGGVELRLPQADEVVQDVVDTHPQDAEAVRENATMFIGADPMLPDLVDISTGIVARTAPGWALLVRSCANFPPRTGIQILEGVLETSWYRFCVPVLLRVAKTGEVVRFHREVPMAMLQPVPEELLSRGALDLPEGRPGVATMGDDVWREFLETRMRRVNAVKAGTYRDESRRRRKAAEDEG
ncbi:DUF6065 family protein [Catenulispora rubra]|uniref:DUF6065 family protein n=1 Tax=Catenulispora rubra TaxID=280293 RepID=UPI001892814D|nr:DUF6065 family protein [Catenulispora rubra]